MASGKRLTKAEQHERALRAALTWPDAEIPPALTEDQCRELSNAAPGGQARAWTYNLGRGEVALGAFDRYNHVPDGRFRTNMFPSRGLGGPWYATREDACVVLRAQMTREAAEKLLTIDARIQSLLSMDLPHDAPESGADADRGMAP
jgi:hypothetical protein